MRRQGRDQPLDRFGGRRARDRRLPRRRRCSRAGPAGGDVPVQGGVRLALSGVADAVACDGCPPLARLFEQFAEGAANCLSARSASTRRSSTRRNSSTTPAWPAPLPSGSGSAKARRPSSATDDPRKRTAASPRYRGDRGAHPTPVVRALLRSVWATNGAARRRRTPARAPGRHQRQSHRNRCWHRRQLSPPPRRRSRIVAVEPEPYLRARAATAAASNRAGRVVTRSQTTFHLRTARSTRRSRRWCSVRRRPARGARRAAPRPAAAANCASTSTYAPRIGASPPPSARSTSCGRTSAVAATQVATLSRRSLRRL